MTQCGLPKCALERIDMTDKEVLERAAEILRENAESLRMCNTTPPTFALATMDSDVRSDYDEEVALASALETMAQRCGDPLYLLHCGKIDGDGEQDEWDVEADSWRRVEDFCRQHPGETVSLYAAQPPAIPEGYVLMPRRATTEMVSAFMAGSSFEESYRDMIAAAPTTKDG